MRFDEATAVNSTEPPMRSEIHPGWDIAGNAPAAYYFPMSTRLVGVEVFKGPVTVRHGPNTVGGAVNLRTRDIPDGAAAAVDLGGGLRRTLKAHAWTGTRSDLGGVLVEGVHLRTDGFKQLDGGGPTGFDRTELMAKGEWTPTTAGPARHQLGLKLGYANETSHETYLGLSLGDYDANPYRRYAASALDLMDWHRSQAEAHWSVRASNRLRFRTVVYHHYLTRQWTKFNGFAGPVDVHDLLLQEDPGGQAAVYLGILRGEEDSTTSDQVLRIGTNDRRFHNGGLQVAGQWTVPGVERSSTLDFGLRLHHDRVIRLHTDDFYNMVAGQLEATGDVTDTTLDSLATASALALYAQEDLRFGRLHVLPGARLEVIQTDRNDVSLTQEVDEDAAVGPITRATPLPGLGLLGSVVDGLDVFAGAYRGFTPVAPGQPEAVDPELSWNYEAGLRGATAWGSGEVVGFLNDYTNISGQCTLSGGCTEDQIGQQYNGGEVWVWGLEAAGDVVVLLPGAFSMPLSATYTWTESRFATGFVSGFPQFGTVEIGDSLPYVPQHQLAGSLTLQHPRFELTGGMSHRTEMLDEAGTFPATAADVPALTLVDAAASVVLHERLSLYATGTNLTGADGITSWRPFGARPTAPLQVMVGLKGELGG